MTQWVGDKWRLKAGPQLGQMNKDGPTEATTTGNNPEPLHCGYKETFVQEYDGIKVYYHQGSYQHIGPQVYTWAFYEYRMVINSECWNIIIDENMKEPPGSFPGSSSVKLTHDFCHIDSESSDDEYTSFSFVEMGGRVIWPFYTTESFQEDLWIWVSPRRFAIISNHPNNEKLNHFYSNKMHEHHILANRTKCWHTYAVGSEGSKKKDCLIALNEDTRIDWADQETFTTGFEDKYDMRPTAQKGVMSYGKRKHPGPMGQGGARPFDATGTYSARDMQTLNATFANPEKEVSSSSEKAKGTAIAVQWTCGQVPPLAPKADGGDRKEPQIAYARTLLTVFQEAVNQMATVVENLEQIQKEVVVEGSASSTKEVVQEHPQDENQAAQEEKQQQDSHQ